MRRYRTLTWPTSVALAGQPPTEKTGALNATAQIARDSRQSIGGRQPYHRQWYGLWRGIRPRRQCGGNICRSTGKLDPIKITKGAAQVSASGSYVHPGDAFDSGQLQFAVSTNTVQLSEFKTIQAQHPDFSGTVALSANVAADMIKQAASSSSQLAVRSIEANLSATACAIRPLLTET